MGEDLIGAVPVPALAAVGAVLLGIVLPLFASRAIDGLVVIVTTGKAGRAISAAIGSAMSFGLGALFFSLGLQQVHAELGAATAATFEQVVQTLMMVFVPTGIVLGLGRSLLQVARMPRRPRARLVRA